MPSAASCSPIAVSPARPGQALHDRGTEPTSYCTPLASWNESWTPHGDPNPWQSVAVCPPPLAVTLVPAGQYRMYSFATPCFGAGKRPFVKASFMKASRFDW